jgi:hypothetical protein
MPESWTVPIDDLLVNRVQYCLVCGAPCTSTALAGVWDLGGQRAVSYVAHEKCWTHAAARRVLARRYATARRET